MQSVMDDFFRILTLIIIVAIIAVLVSGRAKTVEVIQTITSGMTQLLSVIVSPIANSGGQSQRTAFEGTPFEGVLSGSAFN